MKFIHSFGDLKIRYKLMVLHNLFFLVLSTVVWFTLIPLVEDGAAAARTREVNVAGSLLATAGPLRPGPGLDGLRLREGTAAELGLPERLIQAIAAAPGGFLEDPRHPGVIYARVPTSDRYRQLRLPPPAPLLRQAKITLALALIAIYALAVVLLESYLMRRYIYRPLRLLLRADEASRQGRTDRELIDEQEIFADELGQAMRSRNDTIRKLREHEQELERALHRIEESAADLRQKNYLLETAKRNIADQDRLASLGLLSASVAHELNTPLAVLQGSIEKLLECEPNASSRERLERMLSVTRRLKKMSDDLTDYVRPRRTEPEAVSVRDIIEEAWNLVEIDEKAAAIEFLNRAKPEDRALGNPDRLVQLFVNLLRNALVATPRGGRIQVKTSHEEGLPEAPNGFLIVAVEDDGPGIPEDILPEVFEAFVTTRLDSRGTGLGLTVAEGIAHQHGGSISAANRPGGGASLTVRLPAAR